MLSVRTILHPTDFSASSEAAFGLACALARDYDARLLVLHVTMPPPAVGYAEGVYVPAPEPTYNELRHKLYDVTPADPEIVVEHRLVEGDAATEILRVAKEAGCDTIVMGTHGRTGFGRLLMGSVAEDVLRQAPCPVVTVRHPLPAPVAAVNAEAEWEPAALVPG